MCSPMRSRKPLTNTIGLMFLMAIAFTLTVPGIAVADDPYVLGSLDGQNGWDGGVGGFVNNDPGDEAVTDADFYTGARCWRYSRGYGSPGSGTPFTPQVASVGRPSSGADGDIAIVTFAFKAVTPEDNSVQSIYLGAVGRNDRTGCHINLKNLVGGVQLTMYTLSSTPGPVPGSGCDNQDFPENLIATVSSNAWHTVEMTTQYFEDLTLDLTTYVIDGGGPVQFVSWPHLWRECNAYPYTPGASLKWAAAVDDLAYDGFYYDAVSLEVRDSASDTQVGFFDANFEEVPVPVELSGFTIK
jgi:hypothetical protein